MRMLKLEESSPVTRADLIALSRRQVECLGWAEVGKSARDTGQILGISQRTVEKHLEQAYELLGVRTRIPAGISARPSLRLRAWSACGCGAPRAVLGSAPGTGHSRDGRLSPLYGMSIRTASTQLGRSAPQRVG